MGNTFDDTFRVPISFIRSRLIVLTGCLILIQNVSGHNISPPVSLTIASLALQNLEIEIPAGVTYNAARYDVLICKIATVPGDQASYIVNSRVTAKDSNASWVFLLGCSDNEATALLPRDVPIEISDIDLTACIAPYMDFTDNLNQRQVGSENSSLGFKVGPGTPITHLIFCDEHVADDGFPYKNETERAVIVIDLEDASSSPQVKVAGVLDMFAMVPAEAEKDNVYYLGESQMFIQAATIHPIELEAYAKASGYRPERLELTLSRGSHYESVANITLNGQRDGRFQLPQDPVAINVYDTLSLTCIFKADRSKQYIDNSVDTIDYDFCGGSLLYYVDSGEQLYRTSSIEVIKK